MPIFAPVSNAGLDAQERLYGELWPRVRGMLHARYGALDDPEEIYQEAWTELLELKARGEEIREPAALVMAIALRRGRDRLRKHTALSTEPDSAWLLDTVDGAWGPDEQAQVRLDAARIRQVVDTLDERESAALKLRYDLLLDAKETAARLGITTRRLEKVMTSAYAQVADALAVDATGESVWSRRQRSLLLACLTGFASARQRRQAQQMLASDPTSRATLAELRVALRDVAAALPVPVGMGEDRRRGVLRVLIDSVDRVLPGGHSGAHRLVEVAVPSGAGESASVGAGVLGAGAAAKVALACVAAGGTVAACLTLAPDRPSARRVAPRAPLHAAETSRRVIVEAHPAVASTLTPIVARTPKKTHRRSASQGSSTRREVSVSSPRYVPTASPAPSGSTEFAPGAIGSRTAPTQPAAAPSNGGGEFTP